MSHPSKTDNALISGFCAFWRDVCWLALAIMGSNHQDDWRQAADPLFYTLDSKGGNYRQAGAGAGGYLVLAPVPVAAGISEVLVQAHSAKGARCFQ